MINIHFVLPREPLRQTAAFKGRHVSLRWLQACQSPPTLLPFWLLSYRNLPFVNGKVDPSNPISHPPWEDLGKASLFRFFSLREVRNSSCGKTNSTVKEKADAKRRHKRKVKKSLLQIVFRKFFRPKTVPEKQPRTTVGSKEKSFSFFFL